MSLAPLVALLATQLGATADRDSYGVPTIAAPSEPLAYEAMGYAVAQDRLWQMESSRRIARGRMAEVVGSSAVASDIQVIKTGYTDDELQVQFDGMRAKTRDNWVAYAKGVNRYIEDARAAGKLPKQYGEYKLSPEPWSVVDSAAIATMMSARFGSGGGYELVQWAASKYLQTQKCADRYLDVMDDIAWQNDPASPTTVAKEDEGQCTPMQFPIATRADTSRQLTALPAASLLELLPAIRIAYSEPTIDLAMQYSAPFKVGSYAVVVSGKRSRTGVPLLLGAPQMGHGSPSIVHEVVMKTPTLKVRGLDVPGVPGVLIGSTPTAAWTLTTGVADTTDIFVSTRSGDGLAYGSGKLAIQRSSRVLKVRGEPDQDVARQRTEFGPVIHEVASSKSVFVRRSTIWMRELQTYDQASDLGRCRTAKDVLEIGRNISLGFNLFFATQSGETGWVYCGLLPKRADGVDARFPTPLTPELNWRGAESIGAAVHVVNPKSGLLSNWNNKPISWWPNLDTPAWGALFRVDALRAAIPNSQLGPSDLEDVTPRIAKSDDATLGAFLPTLRKALKTPFGEEVADTAARELLGWDARNTAGSVGARIYSQWVREMRTLIFAEQTGNFMSQSTFDQATQPSVILRAIQRRTKYDFLGERDPVSLARTAFENVVKQLSKADRRVGTWRYSPSVMNYAGQTPVPYNNRGTFIQIAELGKQVSVRSITAPGISETEPHANDQVPLARGFMFKPVFTWD